MTVSSEPCEKHEMIGCVICAPKPPAPVVPTGTFRTSASVGLLAEYDSPCTACPEEILVGEPIESDGSGGWRHRVCP